jgi:hypothetical protein
MSLDIRNLHLSAATKFYDKHTLYMDIGAIPKASLELIVDKAIRNVIKEMKNNGITINPDFKLNVVSNKQNESLGYAYLWVTDEKLYNICNGLNPSGTDRTETVPDPNWVAKTPSTINRDAASPVSFVTSGSSWADEDDDEEEVQETITIELPSLIKFDTYNYTSSDQKELERIYKYSMNKKSFKLFENNIRFDEKTDSQAKWDKYDKFKNNSFKDGIKELEFYACVIVTLDNPQNDGVEESKFYDLFDSILNDMPSEYELPKQCDITISGSYVNPVDESEDKNILSAKFYGYFDVAADQIRKQFEPYVSHKGKFPMVNIIKNPQGKGGFVNVTFDDKTRDAQFSLYLTHKMYFASCNCLLLFNLAKKQNKNNNNNNYNNYNKYKK